MIAVPAFGAASHAAAATPTLPCDIYAAGGTPCQAAYSSTRALSASYNGALYQVQRASDSSYLNVGLESTGGVANVAPQASFCSGSTCTITKLYDQTSNGNDMPISQGTACSGCSGGWAGPGANGSDIGAPASALPVTVGGQSAYGMVFDSHGTGYRINDAKNVPTGSQPEGIYMLTSSNLTSSSCCFDFGSAETNDFDDGNSTMNAIYYGTDCWTGGCTGSGPWVGGDLENGMYFSDTGANPSSIPSETGSFLSAWEKNNGTTNFTLKYGNGQQGGLSTSYSGALPSGYNPMKVQNSIELGTGGDNSLWGFGEFFEGAVVSGFPSDATENAVQASITDAGYADNNAVFSPTASVISLKAHADGDYVDAANSSASVIADSSSIGTDETFDLLTYPDGTVALRAHSDDRYVSAQNSGSSPLRAFVTAVGPWESYQLIHNSDGSVSFRSYANGEIVTADNAGASPLIANRTAIGGWEEFDVVHDTATVSLRSHADGDYVTADNAGASPLIANRTAIGPWETFDLTGNADGSISLRAHANGDIVTADNAGSSPLIANRTAIGQQEEFDLIYD
ncbi:arabinofuranosidase catalytic domain-containing protein [Actinospica sp.]|uniref:arabinofuranosidase catalytic domain-containing protein n=1 Tax=Actinospica sp. TaxID=1872142 RepID=UPI002B8A33DC|nr:arabinofuranosidase catalytic domain-containing protein [Actinospica sp.]HWG25040.1 arabinofuranosidase catalytic domain-containing protein [Actinospica sp.]